MDTNELIAEAEKILAAMREAINGLEFSSYHHDELADGIKGMGTLITALRAAEEREVVIQQVLPNVLNRLQILEKIELTCCNGPGESRDDSVSRFSLGLTRRCLDQVNALLPTPPKGSEA